MANYTKELMSLLATDTFTKLLSSNSVKIAELNAAIALLIKTGIPFDVAFTPGTRRDSPAALLIININPNTRVEFTITFQSTCCL